MSKCNFYFETEGVCIKEVYDGQREEFKLGIPYECYFRQVNIRLALL